MSMKIYRNRDTLSPAYVPPSLPFREQQAKEIEKYLQFAVEGSTPPHILAIGPSGSGKTATLLRQISLLKEQLGKRINISYTLATPTSYQTLVGLGRNMDIFLPDRGKSLMEIWHTFSKQLKDTITIFILDEIDRTISSGDTELLYLFSRREKTCIIGISNKVGILEKIQDQAVRSSFLPRKILFPAYNANELCGILGERTTLAFYLDTLDAEVTPKIAAIASKRNGDARFALDLLLFSGDIAIGENEEKVRETHVDKARREVETAFMERTIIGLKHTQKLLLHCVIDMEGHPLGEIYTKYNTLATQIPVCEPLSIQRLSFYMRELALYGIISIEKTGKGRGRGFEWSVRIDMCIDKLILAKIIKDWMKEITM